MNTVVPSGFSPEPDHGTIFAVDVVGFGRRTNPLQLEVRSALYRMLSAAFDSAGVPWADCYREDRGDGALVLTPARVPKTLLLDRVLGGLVGEVCAQRTKDDARLRLKIAVHAGEFHRDENGIAGFDVNHAFRILESDLLKSALSNSKADCAVVISDWVYQSVVRHGYGAINPAEFMSARVVNKEDESLVWLCIPGDARAARKTVKKHASPGRAKPEPGSSVNIHSKGDVSMDNAVIGGRDVRVDQRR